MLNQIVIALWLTLLLAFFLESLKVKLVYDKIQSVNRLIERRMMSLLSDASDISVFRARDVRNALFEEFVKPHLVDELELYRIDAHNLHVRYKKMQAEQEFEVHVDRNQFRMKEIYEEEFEDYDV